MLCNDYIHNIFSFNHKDAFLLNYSNMKDVDILEIQDHVCNSDVIYTREEKQVYLKTFRY